MKTRYSQFYSLLFAPLLVFLFVSFLTITSSNAYALSETQIENWVYNWFVVRKSRDPEATQTFINNNKTTFQQLATISETYDTFYIGELQNRDDIIQFQWNTTNGGTMYTGNTVNILATDIYNWNYLQLGWFNNNYEINSASTTYRFSGIKKDYSYNKRAVVYSSGNPTITLLYNTSRPSTWLDGPYVDALPLTFLSKPSDSTVDVWSFEDIPLYTFSGDEDFYFGQLFYPHGSNVYETNSNFFYRWGDWNLRTLPDSATYLEYVGSDDKGSLYDVYLDKNYLFDNTIYSLVWTDTTSDPYTLAYANFYLGDKNTVIIDGVIDPSKTFSGDYDDKYNYYNDPNQNFWKDTYNRFMTPSGEVLRGTITSLMSDLDFSTSGEESGELMMALVGLDVISNDFGDFIISWDDFSPNLTIKGQLVSSSGPFIPAGQINFSQMERNNETFHDIMQYTRAILSFSVITLFFGNLWHTLLITLGISTQIYEKNEQAKEKLSRQAERDQRKQEREDRQRYQQWLYEHRR